MDGVKETLPVTKAKRDLLELIKRMQEDDAIITITRNGEAAGVLMTAGRYEGLLETIEILADVRITEALLASSRDFAQGNTHSHDDVWGDP